MRFTRPYFSTAALLVAALLRWAPAVQASTLSDEPFGLRLNLALDRGSAFSDIVGLAASVAYPYASSQNPAGSDFLREGTAAFTLGGTLTGVHVALPGGNGLSAGSASATTRFERAGTLVGDYTYFASHRLVSHQGDAHHLDGHRAAVWYSQHVTSAVVLGGRLDVTQTTLRTNTTDFDLPVRTKTDSLGIDFAVGVLASLTQHWLLGVVGGAGWTRNSTSGTIQFPPPPFAFGPERFSFDDNTRSLNFRGGLGWRPSEAFGVYCEVQYLRFLNVSRALGDNGVDAIRGRLGFEWMPHQFVALRAGGTIDSERQLSPSGGVGFYPIKNFQAELAYVYNAFPEVRREFGRAHLVTVSVAVLF